VLRLAVVLGRAASGTREVAEERGDPDVIQYPI
jgi:hypothetical protein